MLGQFQDLRGKLRLASWPHLRGHSLLVNFAAILLAYAAFFLIAFNPLPTTCASFLRSSGLETVVLYLCVLIPVFRMNGMPGAWLSLLVSLCLYALQLSATWSLVESNGEFVIGGLIPWSDANNYYTGAMQLLNGYDYPAWNGRRPLFSSMLAVVLEFAAHNLQWCLAILVSITATAAYLFSRWVNTHSGAVAASTVQIILIIFYSRFVNTTLSEQMGLTLGLLALTALLGGIQNHRLTHIWYFGLFLIACALIARAGPFFILPMIALWAAWHASASGVFKVNLRLLIMAFLAIGMAFFLNACLRKLLAPDSLAFGNFSYSLYGLFTGNRGWPAIMRDHPEIFTLGLDDVSLYRLIYTMAFEALLADPVRALFGALGTWGDFFALGVLGIFGYISVEIRPVVAILCLLGLVRCFAHLRDPRMLMMLSICLGIILSIPFVPPRDADIMRAYAAIIPVTALLCGWGLKPFSSMPISSYRHLWPARYANYFGLGMLLLTMAGSVTIATIRQPAQPKGIECAENEVEIFTHINPGSYIRIQQDKPDQRHFVTSVPVTQWRSSLYPYSKYYEGLYQELLRILPGQQLQLVINQSANAPGHVFYLVTNNSDLPEYGLIQGCARSGDYKVVNFYYMDKYNLISD